MNAFVHLLKNWGLQLSLFKKKRYWESTKTGRWNIAGSGD